MNDNYITRFEVSNFKKFDHLVVDNIGQVNLITGDNNIGKTCLLEALSMDVDFKVNLFLLKYFLDNRNFDLDRSHSIKQIDFNHKNNVVSNFQKNIDKPIQLKKYHLNTKLLNISICNDIVDVVNTENSAIKNFANKLRKYSGINSLSKNWLLFYNDDALNYMVDITSLYYDQFLEGGDYAPFVGVDDFYREDIVEMYDSLIDNVDAKKTLPQILNSIFLSDKILDFTIKSINTKNQLFIATEKNKQFHSITQYGSGFVKLLRIILEILLNKNKFILIDEIDTGIHYLKMKEIWKNIFNLSAQFGVQIFATTHSMDCIQAFVAAGEENVDINKELRLIELEEFTTKDNIVKHQATTFDLENLKYNLKTGSNVRGGNVWQ